MRTRLPFTVLALGLSAAFGGCAGGPPPSVSPEDIPALEAETQRNPTDAQKMTQLGAAYYQNKEYSKARDVLKGSLALDKANYSSLIYLGLTYEELGALDSARASYNSASAFTKNNTQRDEVTNRLALLTKKDLQAAARTALATETALSTQPPTENSIAVFPVRYVGTDTTLIPLERGVTHLIITDLSKVSRLQLLERERVQALVDEMKLTDDGRVDPATGARSGKLLRAQNVVQGSLQDVPASGEIKLDANVVSTTSSKVEATGSASNQLQQLFDTEKQVVSQLLQRLGIVLSPAEQRALSERPTADMQAFLAFSRGLEAEDRGDYRAAQDAYNQAVSRDPNFRAAKDRRTSVSRLATTVELPPQDFAGLGGSGGGPPGAGAPTETTLRTTLGTTVPSAGGGLIDRMGPVQTQPPTTRPTLPEATGTDSPGGFLSGTIVIIITRP